MSEHNYTSLSDLLKVEDQSPPKIGYTKEEDHSEEIPLVTEFFGELYFRERSSSSVTSSLGYLNFSPPLPLPKASSNQSGQMNQNLMNDDGPKNDGDFNDEKNKLTLPTHVKEKNLAKNDTCKYNNSSKLFPPPISTLRMSKNGEPFTYQRFDEKTNAFVDEKIMLPPKGVGVMAASRENGRLRMKFAHGQEEEDDENDEGEEAMKTPSDDKEDGEESDEIKQD